jgi:hypothetical protein
MATADQSQQVTDAARYWLTLMDAGNYEMTWDEASSLFQRGLAQAQWVTQAKAAREPLGAIASRVKPSVRFAASLPGAPDGQYAVLEFHSKFEHKRDAVETVTMMIDDGSWKLAGYFIN